MCASLQCFRVSGLAYETYWSRTVETSINLHTNAQCEVISGIFHVTEQNAQNELLGSLKNKPLSFTAADDLPCPSGSSGTAMSQALNHLFSSLPTILSFALLCLRLGCPPSLP